MSEKFMFLDGNSLINRAFYAMPVLTNKDGEYTNAVYGFLNIFFKLYDEERPDFVGVAFDLPKPTFRHVKYEEYKGTRKSMPDELRPQIPLLKNLLRLMNIPVYELEGYEADDILGTLAVKCERDGDKAVVVSGDKDLLQIASDGIMIRIPRTVKGVTEVQDFYAKDVLEKFGVTPAEYIDVKALMGDASDNIPGVPGIGEKTAFKLIQTYKSIEAAIESASEVTPKKAAENLVTFKEQAFLSKDLATIFTDVPIEAEIRDRKLETGRMFTPEAFEEVKRLGFRSFLTRFEVKERINDVKEPIKVQEHRVITDISAARDAVCEFTKSKLVAFKIVNRMEFAVCFSSGGADIVLRKTDDFTKDDIINACAEFFFSDVKKVTHDAKSSAVLLRRYGIVLRNVVFDVMLAGYVLNAARGAYEYYDLAFDYLRENYNLSDDNTGALAGLIYRLFPAMDGIIETNGQRGLYYDIELPLVDVLADMECAGIKVDKHALIRYGRILDAKIMELTGEIYDLTGMSFNINSPKQLGVVLFENLGLKGGKKTKTGWSTAADVLDGLRGKHEVVGKVLDYRTYAKLKSTYVDGLLNVIDDETGKIHSKFNQTVAATGRLSSSEPNLQNIPVRFELGRKLRGVFIPSNDDFVFMDADYSQIELRILAHMSGDETFIDAFRNGADIHQLTAAQVLSIPPEEVTPEQRSSAKAVNFGIIYGIGAYSLSRDLNITVKQAESYINGYFEKYPRVKTFLDSIINDAREKGFSSTVFNRRREIPELRSANFNTRAFGERAAMNMPIQGTAADIIKIAMIRVFNRLKSGGFKSRLILQVHDELLLEVHKSEIDAVSAILLEEMKNAADFSVPLEVDVHTGVNWLEVK